MPPERDSFLREYVSTWGNEGVVREREEVETAPPSEPEATTDVLQIMAENYIEERPNTNDTRLITGFASEHDLSINDAIRYIRTASSKLARERQREQQRSTIGSGSLNWISSTNTNSSDRPRPQRITYSWNEPMIEVAREEEVVSRPLRATPSSRTTKKKELIKKMSAPPKYVWKDRELIDSASEEFNNIIKHKLNWILYRVEKNGTNRRNRNIFGLSPSEVQEKVFGSNHPMNKDNLFYYDWIFGGTNFIMRLEYDKNAVDKGEYRFLKVYLVYKKNNEVFGETTYDWISNEARFLKANSNFAVYGG